MRALPFVWQSKPTPESWSPPFLPASVGHTQPVLGPEGLAARYLFIALKTEPHPEMPARHGLQVGVWHSQLGPGSLMPLPRAWVRYFHIGTKFLSHRRVLKQ